MNTEFYGNEDQYLNVVFAFKYEMNQYIGDGAHDPR